MSNSCLTNSPKVLTEQDVIARVREVLAAGFGRIEVVVQEGYIHTLYKGTTERGYKPPSPLITE